LNKKDLREVGNGPEKKTKLVREEGADETRPEVVGKLKVKGGAGRPLYKPFKKGRVVRGKEKTGDRTIGSLPGDLIGKYKKRPRKKESN